MLDHGGRLIAAAREYDIPLANWVDLSTGINPNGWPVPPIPPELWTRLPEDDDGLIEAACRYYGTAHALPVAGTQAAIQALPALRLPGRVGVLQPTYAEHVHAWQQAGHVVVPWTKDAGTVDLDVLVLVQPNNPTGERFTAAQLLDWHTQLATRGGWLVLDEAFLDATPAASLAAYCERPGLIILRGLGKFFGLAGARVGFVLAQGELLKLLQEALGPWAVARPARWLAQQALADSPWQTSTRTRLPLASARLAQLLKQHGLEPSGGTALFQWITTPRAKEIQHRLARRGILTRRFDTPSSLRFGLPGSEADWAQLASALVEGGL